MSRILLGVSGGIAAYKACELTRLLVKAGHDVIPVVTSGAQRFVTEETFLALARRPKNEDVYPHLTRADLLVVAPCTANTLAKLAQGIARNVLAEEARRRGAEVILLAANLSLDVPHGVEAIPTPTADAMRDAALALPDVDVALLAAAVADYRPAEVVAGKRPKDEHAWTLELQP